MRINIALNGKAYAIDVDSKTYTAVKLTTRKDGKPREEQLGYFSKIGNAGLRLVREEISDSPDVVTLKEFASRVEALNAELLKQLNEVNV